MLTCLALSIAVFLGVVLLAVPVKLTAQTKAAKPTVLWSLFGLGAALQASVGIADLATDGVRNLWSLPSSSILGHWSFQLNPLAGLMFSLLGLVGLASALVALQHSRHRSAGTGRGMASIAALQYIFTAFLVTATNAIPLLIAWESMSLCAYAYILVNHRAASVRKAAFETLFVSEVGFLMLVLATALAAPHTGDFSFAAIARHLSSSSPGLRDGVFLLALFGFGTKSGVFPLQLWMPAAYDAAPPHLAAILAGGLLNLGLFGVLRIAMVSGPVSDWVGVLVVFIGAVAVFSGALFAVIEGKMRRMLAYSSVENVGFMVISLGLFLLYTTAGNTKLATLALMALMIQMVSHALAKALAFLAVGEIARRIGSTQLDRLGGLFRVMPAITLALMVASLSLAAVAPFSGFASEWLTLQTMLQAYQSLPKIATIAVALAGLLTATGAALGFTAFLRLFVFSMTGRMRDVALVAHFRKFQREPVVAVGIGLLAVASAVYGLFPTAWAPAYENVVRVFPAGAAPLQNIIPDVFSNPEKNATLTSLGGHLLSFVPVRGFVIQPGALVASIAPTYLLVWFFIFAGLAWVLSQLPRHRPFRRRAVAAWSGGRYNNPRATQYTASAYANPFRMLFATLLRYRLNRVITRGNHAFPEKIELHRDIAFWLTSDSFNTPLRSLRIKLASVRRLQHGYLWGYLLTILVALGLLLVWAVL